MFRQRLAALAIMAAVPFVLLACSSDSKDGGLTAPTNTSKVSSAPATDDTGDTDSPTDGDTGTATGDETTGAATGDAASFCKLIHYPDYLVGEEDGQDLSVDQLTAKLQEVRDGAPADLKADVNLIADVDIAIKKDTTDDPEVAKKMMSAEFRNANTHYGEWKKTNCGDV